jgi:hypothetical protein
MGNSLTLPELSRLSVLEPGSRFVTALGEQRRPMTGLNELREQGRMTWIEEEHGWIAAPAEVMKALSNDGFEECKREMTTSRRDWQPPGGVWQGVDTRTGSVASAIWVNRPPWQQAIMAGGVWQAARTKSAASPIWVDRPALDQAVVFIAVDGESFRGAEGHDDVQSRGGATRPATQVVPVPSSHSRRVPREARDAPQEQPNEAPRQLGSRRTGG